MKPYVDKNGREIPADHFENEASLVPDARKSDTPEFAAWLEKIKNGGVKTEGGVGKPGAKAPEGQTQ